MLCPQQTESALSPTDIPNWADKLLCPQLGQLGIIAFDERAAAEYVEKVAKVRSSL